ncbi:MAG: AAC(3) family N-acetyltransferase, partial [Dehalococcoidia bacterium]
FDHFAPVLAPIERRAMVGESRWRVFPATEALRLATAAIRTNPTITHCTNPACGRCDDAVQGGPVLSPL